MSRAPRFFGPASEMQADQRFCTCCGRPLKGKVAWLELDQRTDTYHDLGDVPTNVSQGWFPFGVTCARKAISKAEGTAS
jgi:hypothetical protein